MLPESDRNMIVAIHSYLAGEFTHQGASYVSASRISKRSTGEGLRWRLLHLSQSFTRLNQGVRETTVESVIGEGNRVTHLVFLFICIVTPSHLTMFEIRIVNIACGIPAADEKVRQLVKPVCILWTEC